MSHWVAYLKERLGKDVLEHPQGFAIWLEIDFHGARSIYIEEIYTEPAARKQGVASEMADLIADTALSRDIYQLVGSVATSDQNATRNMKVLLAYGFSFHSVDYANGLLMFTKQLGE